jgi:tRNA (guanine37-N1)-methyltransferase
MFVGPLNQSIVGRARERELLRLRVHDIRDWTTDRHRSADDAPFGGGAGMVMTAPPIVAAVEAILGAASHTARVIVLSAAGRRFTQAVAERLSRERRLILICGHYEGIDERVNDTLAAEPLSIGDYVLTGGELPAMVVVDAVARLLPGVIEAASIAEESHASRRLEYPHYSRPAEFRGLRVPEVLLKGHHARIAAWRRAKSLAQTARWRPDLLRDEATKPRH